MFKETLAIMLKQSGMNQTELSDRMRVVPSTITGWMNGRTHPGVREIPRLCHELGCTPNDLFCYHGTEQGRMKERVAELENKLSDIRELTN